MILDAKAVCDIMEQAMDAGIVTRGGGGDFPRNTMVSPSLRGGTGGIFRCTSLCGMKREII